MITIIDYGMGNLGSVQNMLNRIGVQSQITNSIADIEKADRLLLPGVGAFGAADFAHVRRGIPGPPPGSAPGTAQWIDCDPARVFCGFALKTMDTIALLSHASPTAIVAYRSGLAVTVQQFLDDANQAARGLSGSKHVLNVCADRYRFTVGLAACLMSERVSLLPSTHTPQVIAQLAAFAPDAFCLTDDPRCDIDAEIGADQHLLDLLDHGGIELALGGEIENGAGDGR